MAQLFSSFLLKLVDLDYIRDVTDILMMVAMLAMIIATSVAIYRSFDQEVKVLNQNNDKSSGLLTLGIFNVKEEYQSLKIAFKEIISDLEKIKTVMYSGKDLPVKIIEISLLKFYNYFLLNCMTLS